jgi:sugar lactone lactonase YvrE
MTARLRLLGLAALLATAACAHARPAPPLPSLEWPAPPAAPRVRLATVFPDAAAPAPRRSVWRVVLDAVTGHDDRRGREAWLVRPFGVAALPAGGWIVADPDAPAVLRLAPGAAPERVACADHAWQAPMAVAVATDGAVWVADGGAGSVVRVAADGGCRASPPGTFERPTGLAAGSAGAVFVVDPPRHQVTALSAMAEVTARFGARGEGPGLLNFPTSVALDAAGNLLVVDALNFRIARFAPDGAWLGAFGEAGETGGALARPKGIAVDADGRIYVSDAQRDAVLVFSGAGVFEALLGETGAAPGFLTMPAGLAVGGSRLCVADTQNHRIQVFEILGGRS